MTAHLTSSELQQTQTDIKDTAAKLQTELGEMKAHIVELAGAFGSNAATTWQQMLSDWDTSAQELNQTIDAVQQALGQAAENYQAPAKENVGMRI